ncbi:hypothetical protein FisN_6Hu120 [Fistulifera solaris]|uniref:Reverse transcriptase Ty1/copia-type domain-containing protein n=1 Tax=Fistulifera solaris TaxID=1519565 RepID=A0A1Z5KIC6_FISSO|nr:hypothetical protein FisN_6Hu120 [Fistulifera solaris]|eukprot:GAX25842.1 hypothetical protein FisN_6Hu120 [Fistulifera solaris]
MDSFERMMERAIEVIAAGGPPPEVPIDIPEGPVIPHVPVNYRIPQGFPNPPPPAPLEGEVAVRFVLTQCGLNNDQATRFMDMSVNSLEDLSEARESEIEDHIKLLGRTPVNRGGAILGLGSASKVKAAASLLHELARVGEGGAIDVYKVSLPTLRAWQVESRAINDVDDKITVTPPSLFDPKDWVSFKDGVENYFRQTKGTRKIPLYYVIRSDDRPDFSTISFAESRMWSASHSGPEYDNDNARVYQQLVQLMRGTDAWTYVVGTSEAENGPQDGRAAWRRLCRHYDGPHAVEKRVALATQELQQLTYKSEAVFPMERYVTRMSNCFRILAQNKAPKSTRDKINFFLNNIKNPNEYLLSYIARIRTSVELKQNFKLAADLLLEAVSSTAQLHERGATGNNRNVSNINSKRGNGGGGGSGSNKKKKGNNGQGPPKGAYTLEEKNGKKYCNGIDVTAPKRTFTREEWGKLGDYIEVLKNACKVACELDSHADTTCFGSNFVPIGWTDITCTVSPYSDDYEAKTDIPIAHAATAYDDPVTGRVTILVFYNGLWFGNQLKDSLINPNQCRSFGIDLCDDPWDRSRGLRLRVPDEGFEIPFTYEKNVVFFETRVPTQEELDKCFRVKMTSKVAWDPATIGAPRLSHEEETKRRLIGQVRIDPAIVSNDTAALQLDSKEFDVLLNDCSAVFSEEVFTQRLIAAVQIASDCDPPEPEGQTSGESNQEEPSFQVGAINVNQRHSRATPAEISRRFHCGLETASKTINATTQFGVRTAVGPLVRRYYPDLLQMKYRRLRSTFFNDTMFSKTLSLRGNKSAEVFTDGSYVSVKPTPDKTGETVANALRELIQEVGIPQKIVTDDAKEKLGPKTKWMEHVRQYKMDWANTEPYSHWQNRAEDAIREVRQRWKLLQHRKSIPKRLWDYGLTHIAEIMCRTVRAGSDRTPYEIVTGDTPDISEYLDFDFYDWVWYLNNPNDKEDPLSLGRWLGVSHRVGSAMCYYVLTQKGIVLSRTSVQGVTVQEHLSDEVRGRMEKYDLEIGSRLADEKYTNEASADGIIFLEDLESTVEGEEDSPIKDADDLWDEDNMQAYDHYVNAEILLPVGDGRIAGTVKKRKRDSDGKPVGKRHLNPMMDTRLYEVELADGTVRELHANNIAECMFSQVDSEGRSYRLLKEITNHRKNASAVSKEDGVVLMPNGNKAKKLTTRGWELHVDWQEGTSDWVPLKELKEAYPVQVAEYARANKIDDEPAFAWWVGHVLRKRNRILAKVKSRYWKTTHKFGIRIPKTVKEALQIDEETGTDFWRRAIEKEMGKINAMGAFERWNGGTADDLRSGKVKLPGYREITCHMIFDIKMDGKFTRKARFVADGNQTGEVPAHLTYSSVVTRELVRIAFLYAALNNLDILGCDVTNAYLNAPCREKIWVKAGPEFGDDLVGACMLIRKALYGLKSSGYSWRKALSETLSDMGYQSTVADSDVYRQRSTRKNGSHYWEFILTYVDDILCVSEKPVETMDILKKTYALKEEAAEPERYLGANIAKVQLADGRTAWSMSSNDYVKGAIDVVKGMLAEDHKVLKQGKGSDRPMPQNYRPEEDTTRVLGDRLASRYQQLIGMLRWACELGRVDILLETALMSTCLCMPREGHLEAVYKIFAYLDAHRQSNMIFDPKVVELNESAFNKTDWADSVYGDVSEELPPNAPEPLGMPVHITCFVDANHAGDTQTRRSQTGFIIYLNNAPIDWYSKKQNTCESSTFGSEFVAMRIAVERIRALRYKLRMFGIPIAGPAIILGDNESVVNSASKMEARLNKKHNAICFHAVREACAAGWIRVGWEPTATNIADLFTKMLPTEKRREHMQKIFIKKSHLDTIGSYLKLQLQGLDTVESATSTILQTWTCFFSCHD